MATKNNTKSYVLIGIIIALLLLVVYFIFFRNKKEAAVTITDNTTTSGIATITDIHSTPLTVRSAINQQVQPAIVNEAISENTAIVNEPRAYTSTAVLDATNLQTTTATHRFTALNPVTVALKSK